MSKLSVLLLCLFAGAVCSTCQKKDSDRFKTAIIGSWYQEGTSAPSLHIQFKDDGSCIWYDSSTVVHHSSWSLDNACLYFDQKIGSSQLGIDPQCIKSIQHTKMLSAKVRWSRGKIVFDNGVELLEE